MLRMSCGNCGRQDFGVYCQADQQALVVECLACRSATDVKPEAPRLDIAISKDSEGELCITKEGR